MTFDTNFNTPQAQAAKQQFKQQAEQTLQEVKTALAPEPKTKNDSTQSGNTTPP